MGHSRSAGRPTLSAVAASAGVSISTASLAFSGAGSIAAATRERVLHAAAELGYGGPDPLGRSLRSGRSGIVAVVLGDQLRRSFRDPVSVQVLDGLVSTLGTLGLGVLLVPGAPAADGAFIADPLVTTAPMDVAVLIWGAYRDDPALTALRARGVPIVAGEGPDDLDDPVIGLQDRLGTAELARHLLDLGHRRFGVVTLPYDRERRTGEVSPERAARLEWTPTQHRLEGLADAGVEPLVLVEAAGSLVEEGRTAGLLVLDRPNRPTVVVAQSDLLAAGVVLAARELGLRVPQDVSVAGFDGLDLPWLAPDVLTTVAQPLAAKGEAIARAVATLLEGGRPESVQLAVELRLGSTTGPPPG